jgi:hypothetical protein
VIVDLRNVYDPVEMRRRGFRYVSVGRAEEMRVRPEKPAEAEKAEEKQGAE